MSIISAGTSNTTSIVYTGDTTGNLLLQAINSLFLQNGTGTLTVPASTGTLLSTANPQSGGVIQVVQGTTTTNTSTSSTSFVSTNLTASITPKFSTSKIVAIISGAMYENASNNQGNYYWGSHPYQSGNTFDSNLYNNVPNAPAVPFGAVNMGPAIPNVKLY